MAEFCAYESHGGICQKTGTYCNLGACLCEELREYEPVVHGKPTTETRTVLLTGYHEELGVTADDGAALYRKRMTHTSIPYDHCPVCGATLCSRWHNYCGRCGARMDGADNG